ncbi:MAG: hypothetical protein ACYCZC_01275 [Acidithiobacillus sp.]
MFRIFFGHCTMGSHGKYEFRFVHASLFFQNDWREFRKIISFLQMHQGIFLPIGHFCNQQPRTVFGYFHQAGRIVPALFPQDESKPLAGGERKCPDSSSFRDFPQPSMMSCGHP